MDKNTPKTLLLGALLEKRLIPTMNSVFKNEERIVAIIFFALIGGIILGTVFSWDFYEAQDNRALAKMPELKFSELRHIPSQIEIYINDHFGFRNTLIRKYNKFSQRYLGLQPAKVILGEKKWLFLPVTVREYLGYYKTTTEDLEYWRQVIEGRRAWLSERNIQYLFVVPPNKETIYGEYLPKDIAQSKGETRLEKFLAYMKRHSDVNILDLRSTLLNAKQHQQVYFSTDTHWNGYGLFLGYQKLIESLRPCLPELSDPMPFNPEDFDIRPHVGDLIALGGLDEKDYPELQQVFQSQRKYSFEQTQNRETWIVNALIRVEMQGYHRVSMHTSNPENKLRMVMFHDSFMADMPKILARHFGDIYNLWLPAEYDLLKTAVEKYHPDVVIDEIAERMLSKDPPKNHPEWDVARKRYAEKTNHVAEE